MTNRNLDDEAELHSELSSEPLQSDARSASADADAGMAEESRLDRFLLWVSLIGLVVIAFVAGSLLTAAHLFPGTQIAEAYKGGKALYDKATRYVDVYRTDLWYPTRTTERGVVIYDRKAAEPGLTLFTTGQSATAYLINANGKVVHKWYRPFSTVWDPKRSSIRKPVPDDHVYFRRAVMYPNGDLLAVYEGSGDTPYGYGLVKLDKNSNVLWTYFGRTHHHVAVGPDGRIYCLTQGFVRKPSKDFTNLATPRMVDYLVILSPNGKVLKSIPLVQAVARSRYRQLLYTISYFAIADPLHTNSVEVITPKMALNFPYGKAGDILVSFRNLDAIGVLDPNTETLVWATRGTWIGQHDPSILDNGDILMFDNYGNFGRAPYMSRALEINPKTMQVVWSYAGTPKNPLGSLIRGAAQRLKNGNTLITESSGGRLLEVTPDHRIVWEYINPARGGDPGQPPRIPIICSGTRIDPSTIDPSVLTPQRLSQAE